MNEKSEDYLENIDQLVLTLFFHTLVLEKIVNSILSETNSSLTQKDLHQMHKKASKEVHDTPTSETLEKFREVYRSIPFNPKYAHFKLKDYI